MTIQTWDNFKYRNFFNNYYLQRLLFVYILLHDLYLNANLDRQSLAQPYTTSSKYDYKRAITTINDLLYPYLG